MEIHPFRKARVSCRGIGVGVGLGLGSFGVVVVELWWNWGFGDPHANREAVLASHSVVSS